MKGFGKFIELVGADEAFLVGDLLDAADFIAGAGFDDFYKLAGLVHALERAGI